LIWQKIFKKKEQKKNITINLSLADMKKGFFVDFDLKSWQVTAYNRYTWGDDENTYEWQLTTSDDTIYLEREPDDEDHFSISRKISFNNLGKGLKEHIIEHEDPPDKINYNGKIFQLYESSGGLFFNNEEKKGKELIKWDYADNSENEFISIEQWGENDFEASFSTRVEEYQFSNILPGS